MSRLQLACLVLFLSFCLCVIQALPSCNSDRPNSWAEHRTLYVPSRFFETVVQDDSWADALCCVYTHVEETDGDTAVLELYDGSSYDISGSSFPVIARTAMDDICEMQMGSEDCENRATCVDEALTTRWNDMFPCTSDRPNSWATHRTLEVPHDLMDTSRETSARAAALCCVYTHLQVVARSSARLETYDGSRYRIGGSSFVDVADNAMDDICDMSMGSVDCNRQAQCVSTSLSPQPRFCFPGDSTVQVKGAEEPRMIKDVDIGDEVLSQDGSFSRVYSFGHMQRDGIADFLAISTIDATLRLSEDHMVFVDDGKSVPAASLAVGDRVLLANGHQSSITEIRTIQARGAFAPFTFSGSIVVDGFVASNYISVDSPNSVVKVANCETPITHHWLAHSLLAVRRMACRLNMKGCKEEKYTADGISTWYQVPLQIAETIHDQTSFTQGLFWFVAVMLATFLAFIEAAVASPLVLTLTFGGLFVLTTQYKVHISSFK